MNAVLEYKLRALNKNKEGEQMGLWNLNVITGGIGGSIERIIRDNDLLIKLGRKHTLSVGYGN